MSGVSMARRPLVAWALLGLTAAGALLDVLVGTRLLDTPVAMLLAVAAGFAAGAWLRPVIASTSCAVAAALLTLASQVAGPDSYPVADDLFFFALVVGGPALGGALVTARRDQVRELRRLSAVRADQRNAQVHAARLEERNRLDTGVVQALVQRMGALVVQASGAAREPAAPETDVALDRMEETAREALDEMRSALGELRTPSPDEAGEDARLPAEEGSPTPPARTDTPLRWPDLLIGCCGAPLAVESVVGTAAQGPAWANVVAGLAVGAPLAVRRRWPVPAVAAVFLLGALMSAVLTPLPLTVSSLLPLSLAAHAIGDYTRGWWRGVGLCVVVVGVAATVLASPPGSTTPDSIVPTLVWICLAFAAGVVAAQHSTRAAALRVLLGAIEAGRGHAVRLAVAEQRQHVARDLHDSVAHAMTVVCLHAAAARSNRGDEQVVRASLAIIESTARGAMAELRTGLEALERISVDDLGHEVEAIASTIGVRSVVVVSGDQVELGATSVGVARRVMREALVNVARHAGTSQARVRIVAEPNRLLLEVTNERGQGRDFDRGSGTGLQGLAELVREHGGRLECGVTGDARFRVAAYLPTRAGVPA